eukprot:2358836-Rhodomonas_salina.4
MLFLPLSMLPTALIMTAGPLLLLAHSLLTSIGGIAQADSSPGERGWMGKPKYGREGEVRYQPTHALCDARHRTARYRPTRALCDVRRRRDVLFRLRRVDSAICLRACYAMSGTEIAYSAICLRACYAMSGTEIADGANCLGTDMAYDAAPRSVLQLDTKIRLDLLQVC